MAKDEQSWPHEDQGIYDESLFWPYEKQDGVDKKAHVASRYSYWTFLK